MSVALSLVDQLLTTLETSLSSFSCSTSRSKTMATTSTSTSEAGGASSEYVSIDRSKYSDVHRQGKAPLKEVDPAIFEIIQAEEDRQRFGLELIASENFTSAAVMEAVGSCLTNKYSEGLPGQRYYGGNQVIDKLEDLCRSRALELYGLDPEEWSVNVQPYSGSTANFAAMNALLDCGDRLMGLSLSDGGHLSHGFFRGHRSINVSSKYWQSLPYHIDPETGFIDYDELEKMAKRFCPKLLIGGASAYPRDWDYERLRKIADSIGECYVLIDMAHYSGLVAAGCMRSPFSFADVVTTTTHKSLRSTRAAMIFCRKSLEKRINSSVFPGCQGGPHNHAIAGIAVALREALSPEFLSYQRSVVANCRALSQKLVDYGFKIVTGGTDTHLLLWDLRPLKLTGSKLEWICDRVHITVNKNTVHGDKSALSPGGVRIGTPALTSRGFSVKDFEVVGDLLKQAVDLALAAAAKAPSKKMSDFKAVANDDFEGILELREKVKAFAGRFPIPGRGVGQSGVSLVSDSTLVA